MKKYMQNRVKKSAGKCKKRPQFSCFDGNCGLTENLSEKNFLKGKKIRTEIKKSRFFQIPKNGIKIFFKLILDKIFPLC